MPAGAAFIQSLDRGLAVIRSFHADAPRQTLAEVAAATGLTRATARRFLLTLTDLGYVMSHGRQFSLTPRVLDLGFSYLSGLTLPDLARPHLEALSRTLDESASASVLDGGDIVYLARVPTRRIMALHITVGTRFPAYATSMGRVLLAALPPAALDRYLEELHAEAFTQKTVVAPAELRRTLDTVRSQGWALVDQELEAGLRSVAAPVVKDGVALAAINVSTTASANSLETIRQRFVPAVIEAAARISADLTHLDTPIPRA